MKKSRKTFAFLSALCLVSFSAAYIPCEYLTDYITVSATSSESTTEESTNNTKLTAQVIETGTPIISSLADDKDIDWYKFSLESDGYFNFNFEHEIISSSITYWNINIYKSDGTTLINTFSSAGNNSLTSSANIGLSKGDYYIKIDSPLYCHSDIEYILSTSFTKSDTFETEDNGSKNNADIIDCNIEYTGSLMDKNDNDWYKFTVDKQGYIDISFTHDTLENTSVYWVANIYKSDGTTLINSLEVKGNIETSSFPSMSLAEGDYYIKITNNGSYLSSMDYTFSVNFTEDDSWETETNNTKTEANLISTDTLYYGTILKKDDIDFYKFTLDEAKVLNIDFEHDTFEDSGVYWNIKICQSDGTTEIYSMSSTGSAAITKSASISLDAGDYYLKITPRNEYYYNTMKYQFTINSTLNENWETEVNDTKNTANAIDLNKTYNSNLMSSDDIDWFSFSTEKDGYISLNFEHDTFESTNTYWVAEIYQSDATTLINSINVKGNSALTKTASIGLPAGNYFVKIKDYSYNWNSMNTQFTINYTESDLWETEDNNSKSSADTININETYGGSLMSNDDKDWYKFEVDEDKKLKLIFENPGIGDKSNTYWTVYVYESDGSTSVASQKIAGETPEVSFDDDFTKGTYYIKIVYGGYYYSDSDYSITVSDDVAIKGDADSDGTVTSADALSILQMVAGISENNMTADIDGDGEVTSADALKILQYVAGIIETL